MNACYVSICIVLLLAIASAFVVEKDAANKVKTIERRHAGHRWKCIVSRDALSWSQKWLSPKWWTRRCCIVYNTDTHYCTKTISQNCCLKDYIYERPVCPPGGNPPPPTTYYPDMSDCSDYFQCYNGTLNHFSCPIGGAFQYNDKTGTSNCAFVREIPPKFCGDRPFKEASIPTVYVNVTILLVNGSANTNDAINGLSPKDSVYGVMSFFMANNDILSPTNSSFKFSSTFYKYFWYSIDTISINGRPSKVSPNCYWQFYVNNQVSNVGVSSVLANDGDIFKFSLTCWGGHA